ncbi:MAG: DUF547 domain-containing protein [Bdellovibrionota bacterium]
MYFYSAGNALASGSPAAIRPAATAQAAGHSAYDALLKKYVDEKGLVNYSAWKKESSKPLHNYLVQMAGVPASKLLRDEKLAYWINVYNALTLHGMLHFYPTQSIKDHVSFFGFHFWKDVKIEAEGKEWSLDTIEHEILRKMGEPRIHLAIVCASKSCPPLRNEAYTPERLSAQLDDNGKKFLARPDALAIDREEKTVRLSKIFDWFQRDFGGERGVLEFVGRYVPSEEDRVFLRQPTIKVQYSDYDWKINEQGR